MTDDEPIGTLSGTVAIDAEMQQQLHLIRDLVLALPEEQLLRYVELQRRVSFVEAPDAMTLGEYRKRVAEASYARSLVDAVYRCRADIVRMEQDHASGQGA